MFTVNAVAATAYGYLFLFSPHTLSQLPLVGESFIGLDQNSASDPHGIFAQRYVGSVVLAFGLCSVLGISAAIQMSPVLLAQALYKLCWLISVACVRPAFTSWTLHFVAIFFVLLVGDVMALRDLATALHAHGGSRKPKKK